MDIFFIGNVIRSKDKAFARHYGQTGPYQNQSQEDREKDQGFHGSHQADTFPSAGLPVSSF